MSKGLRGRLQQIPFGTRNKFILEAIQAALDYDDQSIAKLDKEIENYQQTINLLQQRRQKLIIAENERKEKQIKQQQEFEQQQLEHEIKQFNSFINEIKGIFRPSYFYTDKQGISSFNERLGTSLSPNEIKPIVDSILNDTFSLNDFKEILRGVP